ncbi:MAG: thioredoxin family protein [Chitinophagaceae bacterium]|nr:thioredoxin family protein [Chitinophagaceae bacterium]
MKKKSIRFVRGIIAISFLLLSVLIYLKILQKNTIQKEIQILPKLPFSYFQYSSSKTTAHKIIYFFSPFCDHCKYMTSEIINNKKAFSNSTIYMITNDDKESVIDFAETYRLKGMPFLNIMIDTSFDFQKTFGSSVIPSFYIYKNDTLTNKYSGEILIKTILDNIK